MKREEERMERVDRKAAGDYGFGTCQRIGLADGARANAIPNAAGGKGGHGAVKLEGVIHRYISRKSYGGVMQKVPAVKRIFTALCRWRQGLAVTQTTNF
jgi:hypothetical protein